MNQYQQSFKSEQNDSFLSTTASSVLTILCLSSAMLCGKSLRGGVRASGSALCDAECWESRHRCGMEMKRAVPYPGWLWESADSLMVVHLTVCGTKETSLPAVPFLICSLLIHLFSYTCWRGVTLQFLIISVGTGANAALLFLQFSQSCNLKVLPYHMLAVIWGITSHS